MKRSVALLGLSGLLPIVVLASGYALSALQSEQEALTRRAEILSGASAAILGRELAAQERAVRMVTLSPTFDEGFDEARLRILADRLRENDPRWRALNVSRPDGARILNVPDDTDRAGDAAVLDIASHQRAIQLRQPVVGDIMPSTTGELAFAVRAPVIRNERVQYVVSAILPAASIRRLLPSGNLPNGWTLAIVNRAGKDMMDIGAAEGQKLRSFKADVPETYWTIQVGVPERSFVRLNRRAEAVIVGGAALALLMFAGLGWALYRHMKNVRIREAAAIHAHRLEALGRLTGGVAHDLNNLLTPIIGGLELLRRRVQGDEKALRFIANADLSAERARKLVARLLAFSRSQPLTREAIALPDLFEEMGDLLTQSLGVAYRLHCEIAPDTPTIWADRDQLELAILNLVVNARDAMPGGGQVKLEARPATRHEAKGLTSGKYVAITVTDHGVGMDEATLRRAQEPFFSTKPVGQGTGLGLSMAHGFVEQSTGALLIVSELGQGTVVTIVLPVAQE